MASIGCPSRFIPMVRQLQARVQNDGEFSEPFEVKQGCVMAMMFSAMLMVAFQDSDTCFPIN